MLRRVYVRDEDYRKMMEFGKIHFCRNKFGNKTFAEALNKLIKELDKPVWEWLFHGTR